MADLDLRSRFRGALLGLVVGDALGVPVEFVDRGVLDEKPIVAMTGHGTYDQLPGTFSDDGSMALVSAEALIHGFDPLALMRGFHAWFDDGHWSARGEIFDYGVSTASAIYRYAEGYERSRWGARHETDNGNGSLMRMMPVSCHLVGRPVKEIVGTSFEASALTHGHARSCLCCAYHSLVVDGMARGMALRPAMAWATRSLDSRIEGDEGQVLAALLDGSCLERGRDEVKSTGYVVHTLEASLWCLARHESYRDAVLEAVNLGGDSDTTAAVTGGLAGFLHGVDAVPADWIARLARSDEILALAGTFADALVARQCRDEGSRE